MRENKIVRQVASIYGVSVDDVLSRKRNNAIADCRTVICYTLCELYKMSYKQTGRILHRSHADVIYHVKKAQDWICNPRLNMDGSAAILEMECQMCCIFA